MMTIPNSDTLHPLHQTGMKSFLTTVNFLSLLTLTRSECRRVIKIYLTCTYLPRLEIAFAMTVENGAAVAQPNLHQRVLYQAETIPHLIIYPRSQCYLKCELFIRRHKNMMLRHDQSCIKNRGSQATAERGPSSACTTQIRQGAQILACWSCMVQYYLNCMMCYRLTHIL